MGQALVVAHEDQHTYDDGTTASKGFNPVEEAIFTGRELDRLRNWFEVVLRQEKCLEARAILKVINSAVYAHWEDQGYEDATTGKDYIPPSRPAVARNGYDEGWGVGCSERTGVS